MARFIKDAVDVEAVCSAVYVDANDPGLWRISLQPQQLQLILLLSLILNVICGLAICIRICWESRSLWGAYLTG